MRVAKRYANERIQIPQKYFVWKKLHCSFWYRTLNVSLMCSVYQYVMGMVTRHIPTDLCRLSFLFYLFQSHACTITIFVCANVVYTQEKTSWMKQNSELNYLLNSMNKRLYAADLAYVSSKINVCHIFRHSFNQVRLFEQKLVINIPEHWCSTTAHYRDCQNVITLVTG